MNTFSFSWQRRLATIAALVACWVGKSEDSTKIAEGVLLAQVDAKVAYWKQKSDCQMAYRQRVGEMILKADKAEVFLLDFSMAEVDAEAESFPVSPLNSETRVIKKVKVELMDLETIKDMLATMLPKEPEEAGVFCHYPTHGIKLYKADVLIFQTSLCWSCDNYYFDYPDGAAWCQIGGNRLGLKSLFERILPIPPEEIIRFKKTMEQKARSSQDLKGKSK